MIGPAISCGNSSRYSAACTGLFCAVASPRYTSTTYEIAWKVKNEMPIGSSTRGTTIGSTPQQQEQRVDVVGEEVRVLEDAEDDQVHGDRDGRATPFADQPGAPASARDRSAIAIQ